MPTPTVVTNSSIDSANTLTHTVAMPATVVSGDPLGFWFSMDGTSTITTPAGWSLVLALSANGHRLHFYTKDTVDGTEGGTNVSVTSAALQKSAHWSITTTDGIAFHVSAGATSTLDTSPDADNLAPGVGSKTFKWYTIAGTDDLSSTPQTITTVPAGYGSGTVISATGAGGVSLIHAVKNSTAASEDPGTYTLGQAYDTHAVTFGIEPGVASLSHTTDKTSYQPAEDIVATIVASSEIPNSATLNGHTIVIQGGGTTSEVTLTAPAEAVFPVGQTYADTDWATNQVLQLNYPTLSSTTSNIQIEKTGADEYLYIATGTPGGSIHPVEVVSGDRVRVTKVSGTIANITTDGIVTWTGLPGDLDIMAFDVSATSWTDIDNIIGYTNPTGTASASLPGLSGSASGTHEREFRPVVVATLPSISGNATGSSFSAISGTVEATLPSLSGAAAGTVVPDSTTTTGSSIVNLPGFSAFATNVSYLASSAPGITPGSTRFRMSSSQAA